MTGDFSPIKGRNKLSCRNRLRPVDQTRGTRQRADYLLWRETFTQQTEVEILVPLGQTASVMVAQQRDMGKMRRLKPK